METCSVVDQFCTSPANIEPLIPARGRCFRCGEAVCSKCSSKRKYLTFGKVRLCNYCQEAIDGNDKRIMARLYKMAGYNSSKKY